jgi:phosphoribosylaminoimidazole carboxylase (NCAIR synthetase)
VQVKKFTLTIKYSDNKKSQKTVALPQCEVPRYDYEYWDEELLQRVKGQLVMRTKTSLLAIAFNNHFQARLWECDSCVFVRE